MKLNLDSNSVSSIQLYDILFFVLGKICRGSFLEIFKGYLNFFDLKIALRYAQDNLGVKKVSALQKKSKNQRYINSYCICFRGVAKYGSNLNLAFWKVSQQLSTQT
jgi:hypothetical protein